MFFCVFMINTANYRDIRKTGNAKVEKVGESERKDSLYTLKCF